MKVKFFTSKIEFYYFFILMCSFCKISFTGDLFLVAKDADNLSFMVIKFIDKYDKTR